MLVRTWPAAEREVGSSLTHSLSRGQRAKTGSRSKVLPRPVPKRPEQEAFGLCAGVCDCEPLPESQLPKERCARASGAGGGGLINPGKGDQIGEVFEQTG